jgi:predicted nucleotidyltransferase
MDSSILHNKLNELVKEPDPARRRITALAILSERLRMDNLEPILVGGAAVEFYTAGGYATKDVDLALPHGPVVDAAFADLGFVKEGRYWYREDLDVLFEAPAKAGLPGETAPRKRIEVDGMEVVILGIEDLIIDRLRVWVHGQSDEDGRWARRLVLLYSEELDWAYLDEKTAPVTEERAALSELKEATQ